MLRWQRGIGRKRVREEDRERESEKGEAISKDRNMQEYFLS